MTTHTEPTPVGPQCRPHGTMTRHTVNNFTFYECDTCGNAMDERLTSPCHICGYHVVVRPATHCDKCAEMLRVKNQVDTAR